MSSSDNHRHSIRLPGYDYSQPGAYFVTICSHERCCIFGEIHEGRLQPSPVGQIILEVLRTVRTHFPLVSVRESCLMPNHLHAIIVIRPVPTLIDGGATVPPGRRQHGTSAGSVAAVVQNIKSVSSRYVHSMSGCGDLELWQRNYFEHVIRNRKAYLEIAGYIRENALKWEFDALNPDRGR